MVILIYTIHDHLAIVLHLTISERPCSLRTSSVYDLLYILAIIRSGAHVLHLPFADLVVRYSSFWFLESQTA